MALRAHVRRRGSADWRRRQSLWSGGRSLTAVAVMALPGCDNAQTAEASGCRAGLALLPHVEDALRGARVVGDNLAAMRYGAGT
eukprot:7695496-Pyramimonas_sp.AAC.1